MHIIYTFLIQSKNDPKKCMINISDQSKLSEKWIFLWKRKMVQKAQVQKKRIQKKA